MKRCEQTVATRKLILESAMEIFGLKDFKSASIQEISSNASISKGIIYHYFENKETLYFSCIEICYDKLTQHLLTFQSESNNAETEIGNYIQFRHDFFEKNPHIKNVFFNGLRQKHYQATDLLIKKRALLHDVNLTYFRNMLSTTTLNNHIEIDDVLQIFILLLNSNLPETSSLQEVHTPDTFMLAQENFIKKTIKIIFHGIGDHTL